MNSNDTTIQTDSPAQTDVDAVIVGAGFSGLYLLYRLRELGLNVRVYEKADDVGGTWYWNRYPGARCDSESHIYCYSFSDELLDEWEWSERYPEQPEILDYLRFVSDRLDLRRDILFETEVTTAAFDEDDGTWTVATDAESEVRTQFFITAVGCLSKPFIPDFDGLESFEGNWYHTGRWPHEPVDFAGEHVGVIGTGSSGIQLIPEVADEADYLTVFQRTPNYAVDAQNRPLDSERYEEIRNNYDEIWEKARLSSSGMPFDRVNVSPSELSAEEVTEILEERWQQGGFRFTRTFENLLVDEEVNEVVAQFIRSKIRERVDDPDVAEKLVPTDHPYAAKRPPMNYNGYYRTYNRDDVRLVDVREAPIEELTPTGICTSGEDYDLDSIIFATGFDAMTGTLLEMDIKGRDGVRLEERWEDGPRTYLGLTVSGFPNMFTVTGPQSPSVLTNMPVSIEYHVEWISDCIEYVLAGGERFVEPTADAEAEWVAHTNEVARETLWADVDSWYRGANVPGKPEIFLPYPGGQDVYRNYCTEVAENGYEGLSMTRSLDTGDGVAMDS